MQKSYSDILNIQASAFSGQMSAQERMLSDTDGRMSGKLAYNGYQIFTAAILQQPLCILNVL